MKILLVEDERELADALVAILKHHHYQVDAVYDGEEALAYLEVEGYDGVILDVMLPKVDGIEVLKSVRSAGNAVPILLLTAKSEVDDKVLGLDCGADDYLTKPFASKELLARLRAVTRRQGDVADNVLSFGNIKLHRTTFEIETTAGRQRLSGKEFQMLELMMLNPKQLIATERFMEKVWGYESEAEINVVWVNLSNLRKKLASLKANVQIKATRHLGYTLEAKDD